MLTYGDGLSSVNLKELLDFYNERNKIGVVTGIKRKSQYGTMRVKDGIAQGFDEKTAIEGIVNGGFFVFDKNVFSYLTMDKGCILEQEPLSKMASDGQLAVFEHNGFWTAIDTYKELSDANDNWDEIEKLLYNPL